MKKFFILTLTSSLFLITTECKKQDLSLNRDGNYQEVNLNDTVLLSYGDSLRIRDNNITLVFSGVPQDSRCPINAECIWAGDATVSLQMIFPGKEVPLELHTGLSFRNKQIIGNYLVSLVSLEPNNIAGKPTVQKDYKIRLVISAAPKNLVKGTVKDYTGLDGCGLIIVLDNGTKLEPKQRPDATFKDKRVALSYKDAHTASICMVGTVADIMEFYEIVE